MLWELWDSVASYVSRGGFVMWPLVGAALVLWYAVGYRVATLRRGTSWPLRRVVAEALRGAQLRNRGVIECAVKCGVEQAVRDIPHLRRRLDEAFAELEGHLARYGTVTMAIVAVAPLAGLLGTVSGMIETFDGLSSMSLYSQSGGVAGGISQALFSTQMGLAIAVPGLLVGRLLKRREQALRTELDKLKDLLCAQAREWHSAIPSAN